MGGAHARCGGLVCGRRRRRSTRPTAQAASSQCATCFVILLLVTFVCVSSIALNVLVTQAGCSDSQRQTDCGTDLVGEAAQPTTDL